MKERLYIEDKYLRCSIDFVGLNVDFHAKANFDHVTAIEQSQLVIVRQCQLVCELRVTYRP